MSTETLERPGVIELPETEGLPDADDLGFDSESGLPPIYGRCPVCNKPLFPRDKRTGEVKAPPVGTGYESRARCGGCGTILFYRGGGEWGVLTDASLTDDDRMADSMGMD